tara:strand:+ start:3260 stop:4576 length:1317 start_codon:yes stop_codon:yes gene_type:complete
MDFKSKMDFESKLNLIDESTFNEIKREYISFIRAHHVNRKGPGETTYDILPIKEIYSKIKEIPGYENMIWSQIKQKLPANESSPTVVIEIRVNDATHYIVGQLYTVAYNNGETIKGILIDKGYNTLKIIIDPLDVEEHIRTHGNRVEGTINEAPSYNVVYDTVKVMSSNVGKYTIGHIFDQNGTKGIIIDKLHPTLNQSIITGEGRLLIDIMMNEYLVNNLPFTSLVVNSRDVKKYIIGNIFDNQTGIKGIIVDKLDPTETKPISEDEGRLLLNVNMNDIDMVNGRLPANSSTQFDPTILYRKDDKVYLNLYPESLRYVEATITSIDSGRLRITYNTQGPTGEMKHRAYVYSNMISLKGPVSLGGNKFSKKKISKRTNPKKKSPKLKKTSKTKTKKPSKTKTKKPKKTSKTKSKKSPKIHIGPRGGEYIVKKGKKIYQ